MLSLCSGLHSYTNNT